MSTEENKAIVPRFFDAFAANDQATLNEGERLTSWPICPATLTR